MSLSEAHPRQSIPGRRPPAPGYGGRVERVDVVVIGGGIAGVSAGHFIAASGRSVALLETEPALAHHTTGRSAALFFESYGHETVRPLSRASRRFFDAPPDDLVDAPLLSRRGALTVARPHQVARVEDAVAAGSALGITVERLSPAEAAEMVPVLRTELLAAAAWEPGAADLDVAAIHQAFVRGLRRRGSQIRTGAPVTGLSRAGGRWRVDSPAGRFECPVVVDAAGAWCDVVASMAGVSPIGLVPKRRTAFMVPGRPEWSEWPLVADADHDFYFKPDGVQLLCSPADETATEPGDARPDEIDVAVAIDRINEATTLGIRTVRSAWAGLRSFVPDGGMVIGFDPSADGFLWVTGQGGTGIQTAPAAGMLAADLVAGRPVRPELARHGVDPAALSVDRLR
jgi:D-arginine dehydrogenase